MGILADLQAHGAVTLGKHFVYKSGKHGDGYIDMDWIYPDIRLMRQISALVTQPFIAEGFDVVAAPAVGGVALVSDVCSFLRTQGVFPARVWADKVDDGFSFNRAGFAGHLKDKRVLVVEDLITTGGSVIKVCREVEALGGSVIGVGAVCNRGGVVTGEQFPWRLESASHADFSAYEAEFCPLCADAKPIVTDVGHGSKYFTENPNYVGGWEQLLVA